MTVSIIVAVKSFCWNLKECVNRCLELDFDDYEILILPDLSFSEQSLPQSLKIKIIPTGSITAPKKRDIGVREARGEIVAFLDDDAYPDKDWLKEAIKVFAESDNIGCVCGPAVTPKNDSILQKGSGLVYSSVLVSGNHIFRYIPKLRKEVFDFPSCNFLIRKNLFNQVGGFDKPFWPGEDTFLCLKVLEADKKMIYDPKVLVFHHRRSLFKAHFNQIKSYALHRGYFAKRYPRTSLRIEYFVPSIFTAGLLIGGFLSFFYFLAGTIYFSVLAVYLVLILGNSFSLSIREEESYINRVKLLFLTISGIALTHITYGFYFIKGLMAKKMPEE